MKVQGDLFSWAAGDADKVTQAELLEQEAAKWSAKANAAGNDTEEVHRCAWEQVRCEDKAAALEGGHDF